MAEYTVTSVSDPRPWKGKFGDMCSYDIGLEGEQGTVELAQKPETPAPQTGQKLNGTIDRSDTKHGPKFRKDKPQGGGGGGGWKPRDPAEIRAIQRQHSQEMALRYAAVRVASYARDSGPPPTLEEIEKWTDWFDQDIAQATESPKEAVARTAQTLSTPPKDRDNGKSTQPVTKEQINKAWTNYLDRAGEKGTVDREAAKKKAELQMAAAGITDADSISDEAARELLEFLNA